MQSAVLVRVSGPDPKSLKTQHRSFFSMEAGRTSLSASGFVCLEPAVIVTSGWLLAPFVKESAPEELIQGASIDVCGDDGRWRSATLARLCNAEPAAVQGLEGLSMNHALPKIRGVGLCSVAVLHADCTGLVAINDFERVTAQHRGQPLRVIASAFGLVSPAVFRNCVTKGILSNVVGKDDALLLTDARCLAGSEGAMVLSDDGRLVGMVLPPVPRQDATLIELGLALSLHAFWTALGLPPIPALGDEGALLSPSPAVHLATAPAFPSRASEAVALVQVGGSWGSGVLVSADGLVVTCAHVVRPAMEEPPGGGGGALVQRKPVLASFKASLADPLQQPCRVLFCGTGPVDLALLRVDSVPRDVRWAEPREDASAGEDVVAVGHAIFEPSGPAGRSCTMCRGTLAKAVELDGLGVVMLQTSAMVFRGHSGGMLADAAGRLLGVISCNARHSDGSIIPEINLAIPWSVVKGLVSLDAAALRKIDAPDARLKALWALEPVGLEKPAVARPPPAASHFGGFLDKFMRSKL